MDTNEIITLSKYVKDGTTSGTIKTITIVNDSSIQ